MSATLVPLRRGFLLPALLVADARLYGRWDYLTDAWEASALPDAPIPRLPLLSTPDKATWHMIARCLDAIPNHGTSGWMGWSSDTYFRFFLDWMLFGFHHAGQPEPPSEPGGCTGASERLMKTLDLALWQANPYDYLGDLLAQNTYGKKQGFFPTPHHVAELMTQMTMPEGVDCRVQTVCDPCVGTGRLLLHASNHSLRLYGQDIDALMCKATLVNGYLFAPWLVKPLPFLDKAQYNKEASAALSDSMTAQASPHIADQLAGSEHDAEQQWRFEPIKKRKKAGVMAEPTARQGLLFEP